MHDAETRAAELTLDYLRTATPEQRHLYAARSNYDANGAGLRLLVEDPQLDAGTALLIYWALGAAWFVQFASDADVPSINREAYDQTRLIEQRYVEGFYSRTELWFDPASSDAGGPADYPDLLVRRRVPEIMLQPVAGSVVVDLDDEEYDDGLPAALAEQVWALDDEEA